MSARPMADVIREEYYSALVEACVKAIKERISAPGKPHLLRQHHQQVLNSSSASGTTRKAYAWCHFCLAVYGEDVPSVEHKEWPQSWNGHSRL
jgi:hypothetical protein